MRGSYSDEELAAQLQRDLREGESWHIEFKAYNHTQLDMKADKWKDDLSDALAGLASIGGKVYIGVNDDGTVKGISGSHQTWQEKLFERAVGRVKPKVNWKSYHFTDPATGVSLIRIDVLEGEPIYYVMNRPYIRDGTRSRPAEPEEVKACFKNYFANREPIRPTELKPPKNDNQEKAEAVTWIANMLMNILSSLNLYEQKEVDPQLERLKLDLESSRNSIESNLSKVKRALGEESDYYQGVDTLRIVITDERNPSCLIFRPPKTLFIVFCFFSDCFIISRKHMSAFDRKHVSGPLCYHSFSRVYSPGCNRCLSYSALVVSSQYNRVLSAQ